MRVLKFPKVEDLHRAQQRLIAANYDDWNLVTGRVGKGKSKWARKNARKLDPTFTLERIHFAEAPFWDQYDTLEPGQCLILDEFRGHKRAAMHGDRIDFLDDMKRARARRLHVWIVYDRVAALDKDLLTDRNAFWHHAEYRGAVQVREPDTKLKFKQDSTPIEPTSYPLVGDFPFTPWEPKGWEAQYEAKKFNETRTSREARAERGRAGSKADHQAAARINVALVDLAQKELGRVAG